MRYRAEMQGHGKNTRVFTVDDETGDETEITSEVAQIELMIPCTGAVTLSIHPPGEDSEPIIIQQGQFDLNTAPCNC